jgi:hypothetical protein
MTSLRLAFPLLGCARMLRKSFALILVVGTLVLACSGAKVGESCEDESRVGGDCAEGLLCAHKKADDAASELVCLHYCASDGDCDKSEVCSGERGRDLSACRPR